jgi:hypothetical protein
LQGLENGGETINFSSKTEFIFGIYVTEDDSTPDYEYTFASVSINGLTNQKLTFNMSRSRH